MNEVKRATMNAKKVIDQGNRINALKKLMVYYREITETVRQPFLILDSNLQVVTANNSFYRTFKVLKKDTEGRRIYELGDGQWDIPQLRELLEHILPTHKIMNNYEVTHNFEALGLKTMLLNARQIDNKQLILLALEDVTTQKQLLTDSATLTDNLTRQRDILQGLSNAKDEFVALASHQLRTPATVVKQYIGMMTEGYAGELTDEQRRMLQIAYKNNERQLEIIEDLLRVARIDDGKVYLEKSSCDLVELIRTVILSQAVLFKNRNQTVVLNIPREQVSAQIDPKLISMVIENLLDNAGKYSPFGATVTIDIGEDDANTIVSVTDSGVGILKKDQPKLFRKFSRIENTFSDSVSGTGLGLYWAKKVLDSHGGRIDVVSKVRVGTTFTVVTPIATKLIPKKVIE